MGSALPLRLLLTVAKRLEGSRRVLKFARTSSVGGRGSFSQEMNGAVMRLKTGEANVAQWLDHRRKLERSENNASRVRRPSTALLSATNASRSAAVLTSQEIDSRIDALARLELFFVHARLTRTGAVAAAPAESSAIIWPMLAGRCAAEFGRLLVSCPFVLNASVGREGTALMWVSTSR
jgi:hypothetical protein